MISNEHNFIIFYQDIGGYQSEKLDCIEYEVVMGNVHDLDLVIYIFRLL